MRLATIRRMIVKVVFGLWMVAAGGGLICPALARAQEEVKTDELARKPKSKVAPIYPAIARRMNIAGTVKLSVVVAPNGVVKSSKPMGGHPLLVNAAMDAVKQWKFEAAPTESSGIVEFKFQPQN